LRFPVSDGIPPWLRGEKKSKQLFLPLSGRCLPQLFQVSLGFPGSVFSKKKSGPRMAVLTSAVLLTKHPKDPGQQRACLEKPRQASTSLIRIRLRAWAQQKKKGAPTLGFVRGCARVTGTPRGGFSLARLLSSSAPFRLVSSRLASIRLHCARLVVRLRRPLLTAAVVCHPAPVDGAAEEDSR
jgi:hypothetical protein